MKLLLDTHVLLWTIAGDDRLPEKAKELILQEENEIYFSIISLWEIQIKYLLHPAEMKPAEYVMKCCEKADFHLLNLSSESICKLAELSRPESAPKHKDPFDRMLICQAVTEDMLFLTHDTLLPDYAVPNILLV